MAISRVSSAESIRTGTQDPYTFSFNVSAAAKAIVIGVVHSGSTPLVTGLSIGGQAMTELTWSSGTGIDTAGEAGLIRFWELLTNIPAAGSQTVSATGQGASTTDIVFVVWELTADGEIQRISGAQAIQGDQANPTINTFAFGGMTKISLCMGYFGGAAPGGTLAAGNTLDHTHDLGNFYSQSCYETTPDNVQHTIGWSTLGSDDVAMGAVAYSEIIPLDQAGFRWRNDDGNETTATWMAAENTDPAGTMPYDSNVRIRFVIENDGSVNLVDTALQLQYRLNGAGAWFNVDGSSTAVRSAASPNLADGTATTRQLTSGTGTFSAGEFDEVDGVTATTFDLPAGNLSEVEFCVQFRNAGLADGDTVELRVAYFNAGSFGLFGTYDEIAGPVSFPFSIPKFEPLGENRHGPVRSSAGNYYYALRGEIVVGGTRDIRVWKSTDGAVSWVLVHTFEGLAGNDVREVAVYGDDNDILHIFWHSPTASDDHYYYAAWDMGDDTEQVAIEEAFSHTASIDSFQTLNDVTARSDGTVVVVYALNSPDEVFTRRRVSGTWQSAQLLDTDFTTPHAPALVLDPATDDVHFFWHGWTSGGSGIKHRVLRASDNSLSTTDVITTTGTDQQRVGGCGIASGRLFVVQISATGDDITAWHSNSIAEAPTWTSTSFAQGIVENDAADTARSYAMHSGGGRVAVAWALQSDFTIHYRQWDEDAVGWATQVNPGHTVLDGAIVTVKLTHDEANVTLWVSSRSTSVTNTSGPVIRSYNLGAVLEADPDVDVALVTADFYLDAAPLAQQASSTVTATTADAAIDASQMQAGISATTALVTGDQVIDATPKAVQASSSPQAVTGDAVIDATPKQQSASSSVAVTTADLVVDATPKQQVASSSVALSTADQVQDAPPLAVQASSTAALSTADQVHDAPPLAVQSDEPVSFSGEIVTADLYLEAAPLIQQASSTIAALSADLVVDAQVLAQQASSAPQAVVADVVIDGFPLAATAEAVVTTVLVTADQYLDSGTFTQAASSTVTTTTSDFYLDGPGLVATAEAVVEVSLVTGDLVLDAPTSSTSSSGAPFAVTADIYLDGAGLAIQTDVASIVETGDFYIDSASGLQVSFVLVRREEGRSRATSSSGRLRAGSHTSAQLRADREEGHLV